VDEFDKLNLKKIDIDIYSKGKKLKIADYIMIIK